MSEIKGSRILITGGASGIGRLLALEMARMEAQIIILDVDTAQMENLVSEAKDESLNIKTYVCDLTSRQKIYDTAERVMQDIGSIDILINNAGIVSGKPFLECSDEQIERTMAVNVMAHFWTAKAFLPGMIENNKGHVVTVSSAGGIIGVSRLADYSASKFAAFGFDESLRSEFKNQKKNIKTTVVCPYYINTGMFEGVKTRFSFLLPILDQHKVVRRIIKAVRKNKPRMLMPWLVYTVAPLRILPVSWFDMVANIFGLNSSMDEFVGRQAK